MELIDFVKPELVVLVPVLYILGAVMKQSIVVKDNLIPALLGVAGVVLAALWLLGSAIPTTGQEWAMLAFTALVQGLLCAGGSVYTDQIIKQHRKS